MREKTFTEFKENFYSRVANFEIFNCQEYNLLKVVLDGLKVKYSEKGSLPNYLRKPYFPIINKLKRLKNIQESNTSKNKFNSLKEVLSKGRTEYLILDNGRIINDENGKEYSLYFENIKKAFEQNETPYFFATKTRKTNNIEYLFEFDELRCFTDNLPLTTADKSLVKELNFVYQRVVASGIFEQMELVDISCAFSNFYYQYKSWCEVLKNSSIKYLLFVCHYHNEGLILACRRLGIKVYELQHGIISTSDIFYVFPKETQSIIHKALFPDKIYTYGEYWNGILRKGVEFLPKDIVDIGFSMYEPILSENGINQLKLEKGDRTIILITTQTKWSKYFVDYISWLEKDILTRGFEAEIWVKTHPAEDKTLYETKFGNSSVVKLKDFPLNYLFQVTDLNVTIYSTTIFDALRYNVRSFSIRVEACADYINEYVNLGITTPLASDHNPLDDLQKNRDVIKNESFYSHQPNFEALLK